MPIQNVMHLSSMFYKMLWRHHTWTSVLACCPYFSYSRARNLERNMRTWSQVTLLCLPLHTASLHCMYSLSFEQKLSGCSLFYGNTMMWFSIICYNCSSFHTLCRIVGLEDHPILNSLSELETMIFKVCVAVQNSFTGQNWKHIKYYFPVIDWSGLTRLYLTWNCRNIAH